jgi:GNAT superfamily N-acetyltransferase
MYTIHTLTPYDWQPFGHLVYSAIARWIEKGWDQNRIVMVGAKTSDTPVGLAVLAWDQSNGIAMLHSIYVLKDHRRKGLATKLLRHIYSLCQNHGIKLILCDYYVQQGTTSPLEAWLSRNGFTPPRMEALVYRINRQIAQAPWLKERSLPKDLQLVLWVDIEDALRQKLLTDANNAYLPFLSPFKTHAPLEPLNSLALVAPSGIVGWSISYRLRQDVILYDALYVAPEYQNSGIAVAMLSEAIRLHLKQVDKIPIGLFAVNKSTPGMFKLARKWVEPYAIKVSERRRSELVVKQPIGYVRSK